MANNFAKYTNAQLENLINQVYSGSINPSNLPVDLYEAIRSRLTNAIVRGFGLNTLDDLDDLDDGSPDKILSKYYRHNVAIFSGAKTYQQVKDMTNLVFGSDGFKRDFSEFRRLIKGDGINKGLFNQYNDAYLRTEYDTAFRTAQMGQQWNEYFEDSDVFPYLKYVTVHDERVRHDHAQFDGITLPVGHKFWNTHTPPNGFNCRCRLVQMTEFDDDLEITPDEKLRVTPDPDSDLFSFNPAKDGYIFAKDHPYFKIMDRHKIRAEHNFGFNTPEKPSEPLVKPKLSSKAKPQSTEVKAHAMFPRTFIKRLGIGATPRAFWDLFDHKPNMRLNKTGSFARGNEAHINTERYTTEYGKRHIVFHEFGHILHNKRGWNKSKRNPRTWKFDADMNPIVRSMWVKYARDGQNKSAMLKHLNIEKDFTKWMKKWYPNMKIDKSNIWVWGSVEHDAFKHWLKTERFPDMHMKDFRESHGAIMDTICAMSNGKFGWGHDQDYWNQGEYFRVAEFMAHAFENKFNQNPVFKLVMPDLFEDMNKMMDELIDERNKLKGQ